MGIQRENGYSASVEAFLAIGKRLIKLAKTGSGTMVFAEPCESLAPGTAGRLVMTVDGHKDSREIILINGVSPGDREVFFKVDVPF